eukprot:CAMPEP_0181170466 /NCGR_PEP_ID=MMETSP1096-20121128/1381_1 /TAXON_ID=156174 ORGANISM="Chrysochromulina ericina, Strain CCMP281" /NCGR_SAMPLE_ID=MMETSP1096 /ASSEMBLY_ACC=CAM_ASM_000453 /LENGTH=45 /DNA_ID= /DNA_START= /DNA_END= /DNA_ORIENTATION=
MELKPLPHNKRDDLEEDLGEGAATRSGEGAAERREDRRRVWAQAV